MCHIYVGPERKEFLVHLELICDQVMFFKAAFAGSFKEVQNKEIEMPDDDPIAFGHFMTWLYTKEVKCGNNTVSLACCTKDCETGITQEHEVEWCRLLVLADKLEILYLQRDVMNQYQVCWNSCIGCFQGMVRGEVLCYVFENTMEGSPLRNALIARATQEFFTSSPYYTAALSSIMFSNKEFYDAVLAAMSHHLTLTNIDCKIGGCGSHSGGRMVGVLSYWYPGGYLVRSGGVYLWSATDPDGYCTSREPSEDTHTESW